ncbi:MAG: nuclear receptor-binding factor 2 [Paludibacteraceae bacterium]|nr:nuclear receptor-binding factor 2 [Paludibacteraceae bacterium]
MEWVDRMKMYKNVCLNVLFCLLTIFFCTCSSSSNSNDKKNEFQCNGGIVRLDQVNDSLHFLKFLRNDSVVSEWRLKYPVYRLDHGDLDGDGKEEIAVGVIKSTRYFRNKGKRLFVFQLNSYDHIRPLWMGSRAGSELIDFRIERDSFPARVITQNVYDARVYPDSITSQNFKGIRFKLGMFGLDFENYVTK